MKRGGQAATYGERLLLEIEKEEHKLSDLSEDEKLIIAALKTPKREEILKALQCVSRRP